MFCNKCGKKLEGKPSFCYYCGKDISLIAEKKINTKADANNNQKIEHDSNSRSYFRIPKITVLIKFGVIGLVVAFIVSVSYFGFKFYKSNQEEISSTKAQLEKTKEDLKETQESIQNIKEKVKDEQTDQQIESSKTKEELSSMVSENKELKNLLSEQKNDTPAKPSIPPQSSVADFISQEGKYIVKVVCVDSAGNVDMGSGVIMGSDSNNKTLIITNKHVIPDSYSSDTSPCVVAYSNNPTVSFTNFYYAQPVYFPDRADSNTMQTYDFDYLEIRQEVNLDNNTVIPNSSLQLTGNARPTVCKMGDIQVGKKIIILGYAGVGGNYLTAKDGIISGFDTIYASTSAKIEHGDSGGGAFLPDSNCLIGMPTFSVGGSLESLGRVLMLSYISDKIIKVDELGN